LYIKTPERAHLPRELWEKIELSSDYEEALKQIDEHLRHWPAHLIHKNKQRLTKIHQYLIRMRTLQLQVQPKLIGRKLKIQRREKRREAKALQAAKIEGTLRRELQARLHSVRNFCFCFVDFCFFVKKNEFDDVINYPQKVFDDVLDSVEEDVEEKDSEEEYEDEEEEEFVEGESEEEMEEECALLFCLAKIISKKSGIRSRRGWSCTDGHSSRRIASKASTWSCVHPV
jgi:protein MAK16